jgi:membrane protein involved in colicin uptake
MQLEGYPYRSKPENPAGFIIKAIKEDYALPEGFYDAKKRAEAEARAAEDRERLRAEREAETKAELEQLQSEEEVRERARAFLEQMPADERQTLYDECAQEVKKSDFLKSHHNSALFESMVNQKMITRITKQLAEIEA